MGEFQTMSEMAKRLLTTVLLVPFALFIIITQVLNGFLFFLVLLIIQILLLFEINLLMRKKGYHFHIWLTSFMVTFNMINFYLYGIGILGSGLFLMIAFVLFLAYALLLFLLNSVNGKYQHAFEAVGVSIFSYFIAGIFMGTMGLLKLTDMTGWLVIVMLAINWFSDGGGLFVGKWIGKTKLSFLSSPNKTVEGYLGCILFGQLTAMVLYFIQNAFGMMTTFTILQFMLIALIISLSSMIGDIMESTVKRWAGVKDSGNLFPGHGGVWDMFDSVTTTAPVFYVIIKMLGY